jgi:ribosomal protein S18 acetylase RimI-like enzyme
MPFDDISLRRATLDDAPALAIVGAGTTLETFAGLVDGQSLLQHCEKNHSVAAYQKYLATPNTQAWLAVVQPGDAPIGYILITPPDLPLDDITTEDIELKRIYLFARFQGTGTGRLLMNKAVEIAVESGKRRLLLGVNAENETALSFYYRNGFTKAGVRKFQVGDILCDDFILARSL